MNYTKKKREEPLVVYASQESIMSTMGWMISSYPSLSTFTWKYYVL